MSIDGEFDEETELKNAFIPGFAKTCVEYGLMGLIAFFANSGPLKFATAAQLKYPLIAVCLYLFSMYVFIFRQGLSGFMLNAEAYKDAKDEDAQDHKRNVDRTIGNALEQAPIFLAALTIFCFLVNPQVGAILAFVYIFFLWVYPFVYGKGFALFISTLPRYFTVEYMVISVFITALRTESVA